MAEPITVTITNLNSPIRTVKVSNKLAASAVTSVAGRVGDILLTQADVAGLENVNNTSDLNKPVSTATQAAIDGIDLSGYALVNHQHFLADITDAGTAAAADTGDFATASHTHLLGDISDAGTAAGSDITDFAPAIHTHLMSDVTDLADGPIALTNKTLTDASNLIHADQLHIKVKADESLLKGQPVKYDSFNVGQNAINVSLSNQLTDVSIGLAEEDIPQGSFGNIITAGVLDHVNTTAFNEGEILYVDGLGLLTGVEPTSGYSQPIAICLKSQQNNGSLQVLASYPKQPSTDVRNDSNVSGLNVTEALNNLSSSLTGSYATAEQGLLADSAIQPGDINTLTGLNNVVTDATILSSSQISAAYQPLDSVLTNTTASFTTSDELKLDSIASGAEVNVNADWTSVGGDSEILNKPTLGTASSQDSSSFATSTQGDTADSALQSGYNVSLLLNDAGYLTSGSNAVSSVNSYTGVVVLDTDDLDDSSSNNKFTNASDIIKLGGIQDNANVNVNSDWNSVVGDSQILNKPTIGSIAQYESGEYSATGHTHTVSEITDLNTGSFSVTGHQHTTSDISGLGTAASQDTSYFALNSHLHSYSDIIGLGTAAEYDVNEFSDAGLTDVVLGGDSRISLAGSSIQPADNVSVLTNDAGYLTSGQGGVNADWNATSGQAEILNKPILGTMAYQDSGSYSLTGHSHSASDITNDSAVTGATVKDALDAIEAGGIGGGGSAETAETSIYIDAGAFLAKDGEADASTGADNGTNNSVDWYNVATAETLYAKVAMPPQWDGGTINAEIFWTVDGGTVGENVKWEVAAQAGGDDDAWDISFPAPTATLDDPILANGDIHRISAESITVGGSPQDGDILHFEVARATAGATAASQDARLLGVRVIYSNSLLQNWYSWKLGNETADASTGVKVTWYAPANGKIHGVAAGSTTATSGSSLVSDVHKNGTTIFDTKITIDASESSTATAATPAVLTNEPTSFSAGDKFEFEVDTTTAGAAGLHTDLLISWD